MKKISVFQLSIIIMSILFFTGCLTTFYSPRVLDPNEINMGLGISVDYVDGYNDTIVAEQKYVLPSFNLYARCGLPLGFDVGINTSTNYFPLGIGISGRKQFDFNNNIIDAVNIELGGSVTILSYEILTGINILHDKLALSLKTQVFNRVHPAIAFIGYLDETTEYSSTLMYLAGISYEMPYKNATIVASISVFAYTDILSEEPISSPLSAFKRNYFDINHYGFSSSISFYWDI